MLRLSLPILATLTLAATFAHAEVDNIQKESFDRDPGWDGLNNRSEASPPRTIEQDFGFDPAKPGQIGGTITPDGFPAYYAKKLPSCDFSTPLSASGTIRIEKGGGNLLLGFFNADTVNEWRTPNSMAFRINGRGDIFHAHVEYATAKWRAGAGIIGQYDAATDRNHPIELPSDAVHTWSMSYDPAGANGNGLITVTFDEHQATCTLAEGHKTDGATFNHFGLLNVIKHADDPGAVWIGDLTINGEAQDLTQDPRWEGLRNRSSYQSEEVRPRFNFGFSPTHFATGAAPGELGGLFFRGDCRYLERLAYYGARLEPLTLRQPLHASGKVALRRAVSDSTTLLGFFNSQSSVRVNPAQSSALPMDFLGIAVEGPSSQGFYVYPIYRLQGDAEFAKITPGARLIYPNGDAHSWKLEFRPPADGHNGALSLTVDEQTVEVAFPPEHLSAQTSFDRFGLVTPWIDGNGQHIYFDDLSFTCRQ